MCTWGHEGYIKDEGSFVEHHEPRLWLPISLSPVANELFPEDLKAKDHEEAAAEDHEDHVEEEVAVVVVADTVVQPGAVVIHL